MPRAIGRIWRIPPDAGPACVRGWSSPTSRHAQSHRCGARRLANGATLPASYAPARHAGHPQGYGLPVGGVVATDVAAASCRARSASTSMGVRLLRTGLERARSRPAAAAREALYSTCPPASGPGSVSLDAGARRVMAEARWAVGRGTGAPKIWNPSSPRARFPAPTGGVSRQRSSVASASWLARLGHHFVECSRRGDLRRGGGRRASGARGRRHL